MRVRIPLYGRVLFWLLVNLVLVGGICVGFVVLRFHWSLDWVLDSPAGQRLESLAELMTSDLRDHPVAGWDAVVGRYQAASPGVTFALFRNDGRQVAGATVTLPDEVMEKIRERHGPAVREGPPPRRNNPPPRRRDDATPQNKTPLPANDPPRSRNPLSPLDDFGDDGPPGRDGPPKDRPVPSHRGRFFLRTTQPTKYWAGLHLGLNHQDTGEPRSVTLVVEAASLTGGGLFFDATPLYGLGAAALVISALVWLPVVGGITRAIRRLNAAAHHIARGRFDVRVPARRTDELGELAGSVNSMAGQLGQYVERQRRLTADVAHELCSPIARMQRALGIVEQRGTPEQAGYIERLDNELQHMARLVEEILAFSKTDSLPQREAPETVRLAEMVSHVLALEAAEAEVQVYIPDDLQLTTYRHALERALGNVIRNAVRYAAQAGPIEIHARTDGTWVEIVVRDYGPGVPAHAINKIFEPFYRPEAARGRNTGGTGLGLAIVKRCLETCGGEATASLAAPKGLSIRMVLPVGKK